jgi:hypothetical protein
MVKFEKPVNLNGTQLREELRAAGVVITDEFESVMVDGAGVLLLDIKESDAIKAAKVVADHNGTTELPELSVDEKLASVGLNLDDLKVALGLA